MESTKSKKQMPQLWYWSQPDNGFSFEDAETIAKESVFEAKKNDCRLDNRYLYIAFM
ncbi:hypothetical protein H8784_11000 [Parabacteroides acidifaciens]|jgi:hypothetical protein|uniref:HEPN domain-containing protein n=1 Tax=Parabacteroides acidifaciens TaxID=2290935 RepID=A0ABR7P1K2_9BACT|nr:MULTISPECIES: hypothetical protein [Parabacteroides]MBC8602241.1 hypothetical protein [Parabacteroides acidifaciens]